MNWLKRMARRSQDHLGIKGTPPHSIPPQVGSIALYFQPWISCPFLNILVQIPEETGRMSEARRAGYKTICEQIFETYSPQTRRKIL